MRCSRRCGRARSAREVYAAWQASSTPPGSPTIGATIAVIWSGSACPPSWTGGNAVTGLRHDSDLVIEAGMSFHILSWLMGTGRGDAFVSDTVLVGAAGPELLTRD